MCKYIISSITKTNQNEETYRLLIKNKYDDSDEKNLLVSPHAGASASGYLINNEGEVVSPYSCYVLTSFQEKDLKAWNGGDLVDIYFQTII